MTPAVHCSSALLYISPLMSRRAVLIAPRCPLFRRRDLLHKDQHQRLELKERPDTGTYVKDLSSFVCKSVKEIEHVMSVGNSNRSVG